MKDSNPYISACLCSASGSSYPVLEVCQGESVALAYYSKTCIQFPLVVPYLNSQKFIQAFFTM